MLEKGLLQLYDVQLCEIARRTIRQFCLLVDFGSSYKKIFGIAIVFVWTELQLMEF